LFAKKHQDKLRNVPDYLIIIAIVLGIAESLLSRYIFGKNELYIGSLLIIFAATVIFLKYPISTVIAYVVMQAKKSSLKNK